MQDYSGKIQSWNHAEIYDINQLLNMIQHWLEELKKTLNPGKRKCRLIIHQISPVKGYCVLSAVRGKRADKSGVRRLIEPDRHVLQWEEKTSTSS